MSQQELAESWQPPFSTLFFKFYSLGLVIPPSLSHTHTFSFHMPAGFLTRAVALFQCLKKASCTPHLYPFSLFSIITHLSSLLATIWLAKILFGCKNTAMEDCKASLLCGTHNTIVTYLQQAPQSHTQNFHAVQVLYNVCMRAVYELALFFYGSSISHGYTEG